MEQKEDLGKLLNGLSYYTIFMLIVLDIASTAPESAMIVGGLSLSSATVGFAAPFFLLMYGAFDLGVVLIGAAIAFFVQNHITKNYKQSIKLAILCGLLLLFPGPVLTLVLLGSKVSVSLFNL